MPSSSSWTHGRFYKIREDYARACDGDVYEAALLDVLEYFTDSGRSEAAISVDKLQAAVFRTMSPTTVKAALRRLAQRGYVETTFRKKAAAKRYRLRLDLVEKAASLRSVRSDPFDQPNTLARFHPNDRPKVIHVPARADQAHRPDLTDTQKTYQNGETEEDVNVLSPRQHNSDEFPNSERLIMGSILHDYMGDHATEPTERDVLFCLRAGKGASASQIGAMLSRLHKKGQIPGSSSGPRSYRWFPKVISIHFTVPKENRHNQQQEPNGDSITIPNATGAPSPLPQRSNFTRQGETETAVSSQFNEELLAPLLRSTQMSGIRRNRPWESEPR